MTDTDQEESPEWLSALLTEGRRTTLQWLLGAGLLVSEAATGGDRPYLLSAAILLMGLPVTRAFDKKLRQ